jgi:hypothetical protein
MIRYIFASLALLTIICCSKDPLPNYIGEWNVLESTQYILDGDTLSQASREYSLQLHNGGSGQRTLADGSTIGISWCVHENEQVVVLLLHYGQGSTSSYSPNSYDIEVNTREIQTWADRNIYVNSDGLVVNSSIVLNLSKSQ